MPPPCSAITPGLKVFLAEALETRLADKSSAAEYKLVPVRMKLQTLLYGESPGSELTWHAWASQDIHAGDQFYLEEHSPNNFSAAMCGISGPYLEFIHAERVLYFRQLSAGKHQDVGFNIVVNGHSGNPIPGVKITLTGPSGELTRQSQSHGEADWKALRPGRYGIAVAKQDYSPLEPEIALAPIELPIGACSFRFIPMQPRFTLSGVVHSPEGQPIHGVTLWIEQIIGTTDTVATSDEQGRFTFRNIAPGEYTVIAGDDKNDRRPYPTTFYPGVPNRELSPRISIGADQPERFLQFTVPPPAPTRPVTIKVPSAPTQSVKMNARSGTIYRQEWSAADGTITATVRADQPLEFVVTAIEFKPFKLAKSEIIQISPGTAPVQLTISVK